MPAAGTSLAPNRSSASRAVAGVSAALPVRIRRSALKSRPLTSHCNKTNEKRRHRREHGDLLLFDAVEHRLGLEVVREREGALRHRRHQKAHEPGATVSGCAHADDVGFGDLEELKTEVYIYAAIDVLGDGVIGSDDPRGVWPHAVSYTDGHIETDVDMTILAQAASDIICEGESINITGDAYVTVDYWGGNISVMLMDSEGNGPLHVVKATEVNSGAGATTDYTLEVCADYGDSQLIACWDSNLNGVFDPGDRWGVFSTDGQADSNPVFVGNANMNNYPVWLPLGDRPGVDIIPFVTLRGSIGMMDGQLNSLPTGSTVHVVALKYRPNTGFDPTQGDISYDIHSFDWSELSTATTLDWDLVVPSDTFIYLWAFADTNADGMVNQSGEPIASGGTDENGKLPTGTSGFSGIDLLLSTVEG